MTTIILHGYLRDLHPDEIKVEANSAAEALSYLNLLPALAAAGQRHHVQVEGYETPDALYDRRQPDVLHVRPVMSGSGRGGGQIILGIILIAVSFMVPGAQLAAVGLTQGTVFLAGAMMVLGGILQALAPQPKLTSEERSRYLSNGKNTVAIGTRIPMIYGRMKAYGHYISFDIDSGKFDGAPEAWYSSPYTNMGETTYSAAPAELEMENPQVRDKLPTSSYSGLAYPDSMVEENVTYITFVATVLLAGPYDINFATGHTLHVEVESAGTTSRAILRGGEVKSLPPVGTPISFTRNYG